MMIWGWIAVVDGILLIGLLSYIGQKRLDDAYLDGYTRGYDKGYKHGLKDAVIDLDKE